MIFFSASLFWNRFHKRKHIKILFSGSLEGRKTLNIPLLSSCRVYHPLHVHGGQSAFSLSALLKITKEDVQTEVQHTMFLKGWWHHMEASEKEKNRNFLIFL